MINTAAVVLPFLRSSIYSSPPVPSLSYSSSTTPIHKFNCILLPFFPQCVDYICLHIFGLLLTNFVHLFFRV
jgi:hypothetical protein